LRLSRTHTVGLVFENFGEIAAGPLFYVQLLDGVAGVLFERHYRLTILPEVSRESVSSTLIDGRLDGVIWCKMPRDLDIHRELAERHMPIVGLNSTPPEGSELSHFVTCDNAAGAEMVVDHLYRLGHRRILFALEESEEFTPDAQARLGGFQRAMSSRGLSCVDEDVVCWRTSAPEYKNWLANKPPHTAVFAWNERLGGEILARANECGQRLPNDLSVVGFDSTQFCDSTTPRLTAVRQPVKQMAQTAARLLLSLIEGGPLEHSNHSFPCTLDIRESTTSPPIAAKNESTKR
jgi:LacI family transcriptional regulator